MKLIVSYPTNERFNETELTCQIVEREIEVDVKKIHRAPAQWNGRQKNRYHYQAIIPHPEDLADFMKICDSVCCRIDRRLNPNFKPMKLKFSGSYWVEE